MLIPSKAAISSGEVPKIAPDGTFAKVSSVGICAGFGMAKGPGRAEGPKGASRKFFFEGGSRYDRLPLKTAATGPLADRPLGGLVRVLAWRRAGKKLSIPTRRTFANWRCCIAQMRIDPPPRRRYLKRRPRARERSTAFLTDNERKLECQPTVEYQKTIRMSPDRDRAAERTAEREKQEITMPAVTADRATKRLQIRT
jgi:hypothetical protein